jgi:hypothetical protein
MNTNCKINQALGEKILFSNGEKEKELEKQQEEHYLECSHPTCIENMEYLKKEGLFQMNEEQQTEYDTKQRALETEEEE